MKKKVLFLFVHLRYGGAEVGLLTTLKNMDRNKFDCSVVSIEKRGAIGEIIESLGIDVTYLNETARLFNIAVLFKVIKILVRNKPDILHTSLFYANFFGRVASLFAKIPVVITEERSVYTEKKIYHIIIDRILSKCTNRIVVCSKSVLEFTQKQEGIRKDKFYLIYNVVDAERFNIKETKEQLRQLYNLSDKDFVIGTVGTLIPKKGHRYIIEAISRMAERPHNLKLILVGEGESLDELQRFAKDCGIRENVIFMGPRADVPQLMKIMDVFVLPSLQEGFPRTLLEAMYMGLPVVVSNISGIPELVSEGENGFLVEAGDALAIKNRVLTLYKNADLRESIGSKARKKIESGYLPGHYVRKLEDLYLREAAHTS